MNERIRELFEQALEEFNAENKYATIIVPNPLKEKFAQFIVRECIDIISPYTVRMSRPGEEYLHPISEIKKNFGVE